MTKDTIMGTKYYIGKIQLLTWCCVKRACVSDSKFDDGFLRQPFLGKLLPLVQTVLVAVPASATIRELAEIADKVTE